MGTRNLTSVIVDGTIRVAQYGQWDGGPAWTGKEIAKFLRTANLALFAKKVRASEFLTDEQIDAIVEKFNPDPVWGYLSMEDSDRFLAQYPQLHRDTGSRVLQVIYDAPVGIGLKNSRDFYDDSVFCEWSYDIDLDSGQVTVFGRGSKVTIPFDEFTVELMEHLEADMS